MHDEGVFSTFSVHGNVKFDAVKTHYVKAKSESSCKSSNITYHMCDCQLIFFPLTPDFFPYRKTLQLNGTGAAESPLFPQADFSGNYLFILADV